MIIGIVIGSGIFFKSDNILVATGGNLFLGTLVFCIAAVSIIFGSLCIAQLASRTDRRGGIITYLEEFCSERLACSIGWFHLFIYYPSLISVVAYIIGVYFCILFGIPGTLEMQVLIGMISMGVLFALNFLSSKLGGYFQNAATIIKIIPLVAIAILGFVFAPSGALEQALFSGGNTGAWITAIGPIAFAFDGWIVSTSICHEIRNSRRNLPLALTIAPLVILSIYLAYFIGICLLIGPEQVMVLGDAHVNAAVQKLFGDFGAKAVLVFIVISVLGTVNGLIMGMIRLPGAMAERSMFPAPKQIIKEASHGTGIVSILFSMAICLIWMAIHYITQRYHLLINSDVSEISIAVNYLVFIPLYFAVFRMKRVGKISNPIVGYLLPLLATAGSFIVISGSMQNPLFLFYLVICMAVIAAGGLYWKFGMKKN